MRSRRYNDQSYIDEYKQHGDFPKIHAAVGEVLQKYASEAEPCLDIGSNIGLLSIQAVTLGRSFCIGIEGGVDYNKAVEHPKVRYEKFFITRETFPRLSSILKEYRPTLVIARRVLIEIGMKDTNIVSEMSELLYEYGVKKVILQGRVEVKNAAGALYNSELEAKAMSNYFETKEVYKSVHYMESL